MKNRMFIRGALFGALTALLIVGIVSCGSLFTGPAGLGSAREEGVVGSEQQTKLSLLESLVESYYIGDADEDAMAEGLYRGYIEGLGDPYSVYYDEEETDALLEDTSGIYTGVGALLSQDYSTGIITVLQVYENSPAKEAGIQEGDILYKVDGREVTGDDLTEVVSHIKGEEGTQVELVVLRGEDAQEIITTATRRELETQTVDARVEEGGIGYLKITAFDSVTAEQYKTALEGLLEQEIRGLVVDLRDNPGGNLDTVVEILDLMLPEGTIVSVRDKNGEGEVYTSDAAHNFDKPLVVLMNENSASASEIYAGAIQDFGVGQIVGTRSYGKGVVQQIFDLQDGTSVKLTISEYFTPSGRSIDGEGIVPDVEVEYEYDESRPDWDNQLEKALEVIKEQL